MNTLLQPMWDFGPWTRSYHDRVTIYPLTTDGFAEGYTPEEGFNQGDDFSGEGYQPACAIVTASLDKVPRPTLDLGGHTYTINQLMYSDDRRLITLSKEYMVVLVLNGIRATVSKGGQVHQGKLKFFCFFRLRGTERVELLVIEVPEVGTTTVQDQPTTLGVPIMHQHITVEEFDPEVKMTHRLTCRYNDLNINIVLNWRAYQAYVLSKIDYVGTGVYLRVEVLKPIAAATRRYFRKIYGLPP